MIITVAKPFPEILARLAPYSRVFIVGCAACATKCQTGGEEAVGRTAGLLKEAGKEVPGTIVLDTPCDMRIAKRDLGRSPAVAASDALLMLACGAGVQSVGRAVDKPLVVALDPVFVGTTERIGVYHEYCMVCGDCILDRTAGICPVSRCAKGLANGPCGGTVQGKCETDMAKDCAWVLIFEKLRTRGGEKAFREGYVAPRKFSRRGAGKTAERK